MYATPASYCILVAAAPSQRERVLSYLDPLGKNALSSLHVPVFSFAVFTDWHILSYAMSRVRAVSFDSFHRDVKVYSIISKFTTRRINVSKEKNIMTPCPAFLR
jgi:hypothetical protein